MSGHVLVYYRPIYHQDRGDGVAVCGFDPHTHAPSEATEDAHELHGFRRVAVSDLAGFRECYRCERSRNKKQRNLLKRVTVKTINGYPWFVSVTGDLSLEEAHELKRLHDLGGISGGDVSV